MPRSGARARSALSGARSGKFRVLPSTIFGFPPRSMTPPSSMTPHCDARGLPVSSRSPRFGPVGEEAQVGGELGLRTHFCRGASLAWDAAWSWAGSTRRRTRQHTRSRPSSEPVLLAQSATGRIVTGGVYRHRVRRDCDGVEACVVDRDHHSPCWLATRRCRPGAGLVSAHSRYRTSSSEPFSKL